MHVMSTTRKIMFSVPVRILTLGIFGTIISGLPDRIPEKRTANNDRQFKRWPYAQIPYYLDSVYDAKNAQLIKLAMLRVMSDLQMCAAFIQVGEESSLFKLKITPYRTNNGSVERFCNTFPGMFEPGFRRGDKEQRMIITWGQYGCLDGSLRRLMKYFTLVLGKRNEHQRPDRDKYIQINPAAVIPEMANLAYRSYGSDEAFLVCPYDYCSVTHNLADEYLPIGSKTPAFTVKLAPFFIPNLDRLSECDCKEISAIYGCEVDRCSTLDCASQVNLPPREPQAEITTRDPAVDQFSSAITSTTVSAQSSTVATTVTQSGSTTTICHSTVPTTANTSPDGTVQLSTVTTLSPTLPLTTAAATTATTTMTTAPATTPAQGTNSATLLTSSSRTTCTVQTVGFRNIAVTESPQSVTSLAANLTAKYWKRSGRKQSDLRVINISKFYVKWPQNKVPYYIDSHYTKDETTIIKAAIDKVSENLKDCVKFKEVAASSSEFKLKISPFAENNTEDTQCSSYSGLFEPYMKSRKEQLMVLARGSDGCLGGTKHNILKYFAICLGKRTEHQRPDRDGFIKLLDDNINAGMDFAYKQYTWNEGKSKYPYDYCSVTHNQQDIFAKPGKMAFDVVNPPFRIPMLDRFSEIDCKELSEFYGCPPEKCDALECHKLLPTTTTAITTSPTTQTSTQNSQTSSPESTTQPTATPSVGTATTRVTTGAASQLTTVLPVPVGSSALPVTTVLSVETTPVATTPPLPTTSLLNAMTSETTTQVAMTTLRATTTMPPDTNTSPLTTSPVATTMPATILQLATTTLGASTPTESSMSASSASTTLPIATTLTVTIPQLVTTEPATGAIVSTTTATTEPSTSPSAQTTTATETSTSIPTTVSRDPGSGAITVCFCVTVPPAATLTTFMAQTTIAPETTSQVGMSTATVVCN